MAPIDTRTFEMAFGERVASVRKERGLTQQGLADLAEIHMMQVHRYESGASLPSLEVLKKLAVALRVSADQLLFEEAERRPDEELRLQFEAVSRLHPDEKHVIREVVDSILLKHDARRWIQPAATTLPAPAKPRAVKRAAT
jgi:transcriptional regulator with XRE-family HTH domain